MQTTSYEVAVSSSPIELARQLETTLGARITAVIASVSEARAVRQWATGARAVSNPEVLRRLRTALHAALEIEHARDRDTARSWFEACNPDLELRTPAQVLRDDPPDEAGPAVLKAALQFATNAATPRISCPSGHTDSVLSTDDEGVGASADQPGRDRHTSSHPAAQMEPEA